MKTFHTYTQGERKKRKEGRREKPLVENSYYFFFVWLLSFVFFLKRKRIERERKKGPNLNLKQDAAARCVGGKEKKKGTRQSLGRIQDINKPTPP